MTYELFTALSAFAFVTSITPGPNNLMLMASGANFGFRRTIPHMLGVGLGSVLMVLLVGAGLAQIFDRYPASYAVLKIFSVGYLLYLARKIATSHSPSRPENAGAPFIFVQAALFQWVNPKAWAMSLTAVSVYAPSQSLAMIALVAVVFGAINLPAVSSWVILGRQLRHLLTNTKRLRAFNYVMAGLLLLSPGPVLMP